MKLLAFFLLLISFVFAEKVEIAAERFYADQKGMYSVFGGNVRIKKSFDELNASKVYVYFDKKNKPIMYQADGNVSFHVQTEDNATYIGSCDSLVYSPTKKEYHFMKNVKINEQVSKRTLSGEKIVVNVHSGTAVVEGERKKPIRITLDIDDSVNTKRKGLSVSDANISDANSSKK